MSEKEPESQTLHFPDEQENESRIGRNCFRGAVVATVAALAIVSLRADVPGHIQNGLEQLRSELAAMKNPLYAEAVDTAESLTSQLQTDPVHETVMPKFPSYEMTIWKGVLHYEDGEIADPIILASTSDNPEANPNEVTVVFGQLAGNADTGPRVEVIESGTASLETMVRKIANVPATVVAQLVYVEEVDSYMLLAVNAQGEARLAPDGNMITPGLDLDSLYVEESDTRMVSVTTMHSPS